MAPSSEYLSGYMLGTVTWWIRLGRLGYVIEKVISFFSIWVQPQYGLGMASPKTLPF